MEVHANLGISLAALNRFEAAEPHLIFAAEHKKPKPFLKVPDAALQSLVPTLRALAVTQVVLGRPSACDTISRVIDLEPTDLRYLNQLYKICLQKARFAEAIHLLRSTLKHHP